MRAKFVLTSLIALLFCATFVYAEKGSGQSMLHQMKAKASNAVEVGNVLY